jgi:hypothetical protein
MTGFWLGGTNGFATRLPGLYRRLWTFHSALVSLRGAGGSVTLEQGTTRPGLANMPP